MKLQPSYEGITEVTTDTTDRNDQPTAVAGIGNYAAAWSVVSNTRTM